MIGREYYKKITTLINNKTGIVFDERKKYYIETRVKEHMDELEISSLRDYMVLLISNNVILDDFISKITVNETYFYRDFDQIEAFGEIVQDKGKGVKKGKGVRVLSLPSSTGEEPYTLALASCELLRDCSKTYIIGVDIDKKALETAKRGVYSDRSVSRLPEEYLSKYFSYISGFGWSVCSRLRSMVRFYKGNVLDRVFIKSLGKFDVIFCRNLLIYFDDESRKKAVNHLYSVLDDDGWLFLGAAESMSRISSLFKPYRVKKAIAYRKEEKK